MGGINSADADWGEWSRITVPNILWVLPWPEGDKTPQQEDIRKSVVNLMSEDS